MQALGLIETRGLIAAVECADAMLKAAEVTLLEKTYVGGGLVSITVTGGVAAVKAAVEAGVAAVKQIDYTLLVSEHVIPRPHEELNNLIGSIKQQKNVEIQNIEPVRAEFGEKAATLDTATEDITVTDIVTEGTTIADITAGNTLGSDLTAEDKIAANTATKDSEITENPEEKEIFSLNMSFNEINKGIVDKIVLEYNLEKALEFLNRIKVTKLRNLAREYDNMGIAGRMISKADKKMLLAEFKKYYRKN